MTSFGRLSIVLLVVLAGACREPPASSPVSPSPLPPTNFVPTRETTRLAIAGRVVDGDGNPVAGAKVTPWNTHTPSETGISDVTGAFALTLSVTSRDRVFSVTVEKAGYETGELGKSLETAANTLLRIHRIQRIGAGDSADIAIDKDDTACGYHWGYVCRRVHIVSSRDGTLTIEVVADAKARIGMLVGPEGFPQQLEPRRTLEVTAGAETVAEIAAESLTSAASFALKTALGPAH